MWTQAKACGYTIGYASGCTSVRVDPPVSDWSPVGNLLVSRGGVFAEVAGDAPSVGPAQGAARDLGISLALLASAGIIYSRQDHVG